MKIVAYNGSPRVNGHNALILRTFEEILKADGHEWISRRLYDFKMSGCLDCGVCKTKAEVCCLKDDFTANLSELMEADLIILSTPIFLGSLCGQMKLFLDRWCTFFTGNFLARQVLGKKFITVTTSVSPAARFQNVTDYLNYWLGDFFKLEKVGNVVIGDLRHDMPPALKPEMIEQVQDMAKLVSRDARRAPQP
jgi:multimeric flavodoxin WrbA